MLPVFFNINQIVDQVDGAGDETKENKTNNGFGKGIKLKKFNIKNQSDKDSSVFVPLVGTERFEKSKKQVAFSNNRVASMILKG
jgi:hypothetical protein